MTVVSTLANNYNVFHKALIFLLRLAWKSRIRLPYLIMIGFMVLDIRLTLEIVVDVGRQTPEELGINQMDSDSDDSEEESERYEQIMQ